MLMLISPAKRLDFETTAPALAATPPRFAGEAERLAHAAARLGPKRLRELMGISEPLARLNVERFRGFDEAPARAAMFAFAGDVYRGLDARSMAPAAVTFAAAHLRILSGLYGLLRPTDAIRPYRLEMGTGWAPGRAKTLYAFWGDRVSRALADDLAAEGSGEILDLASREYAQVVRQAPPANAHIVGVDFRDLTADGLRFNSFAAKHARGALARWCCDEQIGRIADVRTFACDGYAFDAEGSTESTLRFVRRR